MIHVSNIGGLEIAVDRDRSMSVERKVHFWEGDISDLRKAPLLPEVTKMPTSKKLLDFKCKPSIWVENGVIYLLTFHLHKSSS